LGDGDAAIRMCGRGHPALVIQGVDGEQGFHRLAGLSPTCPFARSNITRRVRF
jgi:hypothetical protein